MITCTLIGHERTPTHQTNPLVGVPSATVAGKPPREPVAAGIRAFACGLAEVWVGNLFAMNTPVEDVDRLWQAHLAHPFPPRLRRMQVGDIDVMFLESPPQAASARGCPAAASWIYSNLREAD